LIASYTGIIPSIQKFSSGVKKKKTHNKTKPPKNLSSHSKKLYLLSDSSPSLSTASSGNPSLDLGEFLAR